MQEFQGDADNKGAQGRAVAALGDDSEFFLVGLRRRAVVAPVRGVA